MARGVGPEVVIQILFRFEIWESGVLEGTYEYRESWDIETLCLLKGYRIN